MPEIDTDADSDERIPVFRRYDNLLPATGTLPQIDTSEQLAGDRAFYEERLERVAEYWFPDREPTAEEADHEIEMMEARDKSLRQVYDDLHYRIAHLPHPRAEDLALGIYVEAIEPQARAAILAMQAKGYPTNSSGFWGRTAQQIVDGHFIVPPEAYKPLEELGAKVIAWVGDVATGDWVDASTVSEGTPIMYEAITFSPKTANLSDMKRQWDAIAGVLPEHPETFPVYENERTRTFEDMISRGTLTKDFLPWWLSFQPLTEDRVPVPKLFRAARQDPAVWARALEIKEERGR